MEKILILNGSPKGKNGNTAKLIDQFMRGYQMIKSNSHIDYVELYKKNIKNCIGCFNCWSKTPGKCIHQDDMDTLLQQYEDADLVIWATPLYHYGMTSILKTFVERTLPVNKPYIIKNEGKFTHPQRCEISRKKNILISNCGFPEHHNFDVMTQSFKKITNDCIDESILCIMGELLSVEQLDGRIQWYMDVLKKAGEEYAQNGQFNLDTRNILHQPLVPVEDFIEIANLSWEAEGETPPSLDEAMNEKISSNTKHKKVESNMENKMVKYLQNSSVLGINGEKWMSISFIPWMLSWLFIGGSNILGVWGALLLSVVIVAIKMKSREVTYFEKMSVLYFSVLGLLEILGISFSSTVGTLLNYFAIALIWGVSVLDRKPLTADYSKHRFKKDIEGDIIFFKIFIKTNEILTLFWSGMFIIQGGLFILLKQLNLVKLSPLIYILIFVALKFTLWFSSWYPRHIISGHVGASNK
ncbi:flavodoxin family protein [Sedimentibacter sp. zth1]|uniref:flavodoxin family protein n=1 Tax=Sedimentibacter sp. zth1 TaxID=2816908 RepID=UPI001A934853|nr:flavodoxin family protein [Sedimentibacter sp. zth1]QSX05723.1 flavodoxin family protein [Sedimentibacter sp. zth1]